MPIPALSPYDCRRTAVDTNLCMDAGDVLRTVNAVQIAIEINFEHRRWMAGGAASLGRCHSGELQRHLIQSIDEGLDGSSRLLHVPIRKATQPF